MKKIKIFLILFVLIIILILYFVALPKCIYTLDKVSSMLNSATFPENVHIHCYSYTIDYTSYRDIYVKDDIEYHYNKAISNNSNIDDYNIDAISIYDETKTISISNIDKTILVFNNNTYNVSVLETLSKNSFFIAVEQHGLYEHRGIYQYCGKETVNERKCIKVSMTDNYDNETSVDYYYIDLETNLIVKQETYSGNNIDELELDEIDTYEYYFNSVTDDDIPEFDINDYPDYKYTEF